MGYGTVRIQRVRADGYELNDLVIDTDQPKVDISLSGDYITIYRADGGLMLIPWSTVTCVLTTGR